MAKQEKENTSRYRERLQYRKKLSGNKGYTSTNNGQPKKLPIPLPLFEDQG